jgi:hypothetical protein
MKNAKTSASFTGLSTVVLGAAFIATLGAMRVAQAQDECGSAAVLSDRVPQSFSFTPNFPTPSANIPSDAQCADGTFLWNNNTPDLWFRFVAPYTGLATFDTCYPDQFSGADTSIALYAGECGALVQVACSGDYFGSNPSPSGCSATSARVANFQVTAGSTYLVRVGKVENPDVGGANLPGSISVRMSRVAAWGFAQAGELEIAPTVGVPTRVTAGQRHALALRDDGVVVAWGDNTQQQASVPSGLGTVVAIAAGSTHSLALRSNGSVAGWGSDTNGRSSGGASLINAVDIAAGSAHSLAALSTGSVFGWGLGTSGQTTIPAGLTGVVQVTAGNTHSVARRSNGTVAAWGGNTFQQTAVPAGLSGVADISASAVSNHTLALRSDGTVAAWGRNNLQQTAVPAGLSNVIDIAAGGEHSLALRADGTIVAWGRSSEGQTNVPTNGGSMAQIAAGSLFSVAIYDECPTDPAKSSPGICGCGSPDIDTDGDGALDCNDECPTNSGLITRIVYFADVDQDGFGSATNTTAACQFTAPAGYVTNSSDCNDNARLYVDGDGDGFGAGAAVACGVATNTDCNDGNNAINPGATEVCDAGNVDENCNSLADNADAGALASTKSDFYADSDNDTYTVAAASRFCDLPAGHRVAVSAAIDCDDANAAINPAATEICDAGNVDENCNNLADNADAGALASTKSDFYADADNDTFTVVRASQFCDLTAGFRAAVSASIDCNST